MAATPLTTAIPMPSMMSPPLKRARPRGPRATGGGLDPQGRAPAATSAGPRRRATTGVEPMRSRPEGPCAERVPTDVGDRCWQLPTPLQTARSTSRRNLDRPGALAGVAHLDVRAEERPEQRHVRPRVTR